MPLTDAVRCIACLPVIRDLAVWGWHWWEWAAAQLLQCSGVPLAGVAGWVQGSGVPGWGVVRCTAGRRGSALGVHPSRRSHCSAGWLPVMTRHGSAVPGSWPGSAVRPTCTALVHKPHKPHKNLAL